MNQETPQEAPHEDIRRGLPMFSAADPEVLAQEKAELAELAGKPVLTRWRGYARKTGPGWLQSAMTLGGGSAVSSLTIGALFGYDLLWVQPLAMLLGIIMLSAMAHQTLSTGARAFGAVGEYVSPAIAWAWAVLTLAATVIWHFPQYALAAGMGEDMVKAATGWEPTGGGQTTILLVIGFLVLAISIAVTWSYGSGLRGIRLYEGLLKGMVGMIILAFLVVVVRAAFAGDIPWGKVLWGFVPHIPDHEKAPELIMGALGAAVGINMTFLYPYSLLARGWGREHAGLAKFDLVTGMLLPFTIATGLIVVASACTIHGAVDVTGKIAPVDAGRIIESSGVGPVFGRIIFGLGILGMALSSITTHMLVCGFAGCEIFGLEPGGLRYKLCCLIPVPGVLGVVLWQHMGTWIAVRTSAICGIMLPVAYVAFLVLNNRRDYLGEDMPTGGRRVVWNLAMGVAIATVVASIAFFLINNYDKIFSLSA